MDENSMENCIYLSHLMLEWWPLKITGDDGFKTPNWVLKDK